MIQEFSNPEEFLVEMRNYKTENPFYTEAYFSNYFRKYPNKKYKFYRIKDEGGDRGIVAFEVSKELPGLSVLNFVAHRKANYHSYLCNPNDVQYVHQEIKNFLRKKKCAVKIEYYDINSESPLYRCLSSDPEVMNKIELYECPAVYLNIQFDEYFQQQIKESKKRTEIRKFIKKLNGIGTLQLITLEDKESFELNRAMIDQIFLVHKERFDGVYTPSHFSDIQMRDYYSNLIEDTIKAGVGYLSILLLDNTVISFIYCLRNGEVLTDWIPAFDPAFTKYNLGTAHYYLLFEKLCNGGWCKYFDFSKGDSVYKRRWANTSTSNYSFDLQIGSNPLSQFVGLIDSTKNSMKVKLREKGILKKIKKFMGSFVKENVGEDISYVHIDIVETDSCIDGNFSYDLIRHGEISKREYILNALYAGNKVNITKHNEYSITAEVEKQ